ncbi:MAG TPA: hypothetical protein VG370_17545 [Chloroflexota bacterium]|nr:hypothetical protein [Chloroflexota bacterium]
MARLDRFEERWHQETAEILTGMKDWRVQHPTATFREIEAALDERLAGMRARMLAELALASRAADQSGQAPEGRARCPACGARLEPRGTHRRTVLTDRGREVRLDRDYAVCPSCGTGLFPPGRRA